MTLSGYPGAAQVARSQGRAKRKTAQVTTETRMERRNIASRSGDMPSNPGPGPSESAASYFVCLVVYVSTSKVQSKSISH